MNHNRNILRSQLTNKLKGKCVAYLGTRAFMNALPFDETEVVIQSDNFANYAKVVMESLHPESLLDKAIVYAEKAGNSAAVTYLRDTNMAIESIVKDAVNRIICENATSDSTTPEIVKQAKLDESEMERLVNASKSNGLGQVGDIIKDKVIDTIKTEKAEYERAEKLKDEISEVLNASKDDTDLGDLNDDASLESYYNTALQVTDPRDHISFFSKLQDICMEALLHSETDEDSEINFQVIEKVTLESTFDMFDRSNMSIADKIASMTIVTESIGDIPCHSGNTMSTDAIKADKAKKLAKIAFICTICITTMLETLKTMHLAKPTMEEVQKFVSGRTDVTKISNLADNVSALEPQIKQNLDEVRKSVALGSMTEYELSEVRENLTNLKSSIEKIPTENADIKTKNKKTEYLTKVTEAIHMVNSKISAMEDAANALNEPLSGELSRRKEENIVALEKISKSMCRKPAVESIVIRLDGSMKSTDKLNTVALEAHGLNHNNEVIDHQTFNLHLLDRFGVNAADIVQESAKLAALGNRPMYLYFTDTQYSVPVEKEYD